MPGRLRAWLTVNDVSTDQGGRGAYPDLRPLVVDAPPAEVYRQALAEARVTPRWTVVSERRDGLELAAEARTRWLGFVDDVEVRVAGEDDGPSRVDVRSSSRVGRGDLGTNARRIRSYLERLASRISSSRRR